MDPETIDALGLRCPLPVLRLARRLRALPPGAEVRLLASDPLAAVDVPHFCAQGGHVLVTQAAVPGGTAFLVRRGG